MPDPLSELSLEQLRRRTSAKWQRYAPDVLPMWVAEMDVAPARPIVAALNAAVESGDTGYASGSAYPEALAAFARRRWAWGFDPEQAAVVPDLMSGVVELIRVLSAPGDAVVVNPPVYTPFYSALAHTGRSRIESPLGTDHRLDLGDLDRAFAEARGSSANPVYLLCSPHNPTGTVHTDAELAEVARLAQHHGVAVIADEIHAPLVYSDATFTPYLTLDSRGGAFALLSASKAWNLAGIKAAVAVAGSPGEELERLAEVAHPASHLGVIAHTAALSDGDLWLDELIAGLERNRDQLAVLVGDLLEGVDYQPPQATFLAWLDFRRLGIGSDPASVLLDRGRVALNGGPSFGSGGAGHARLNFACPPQILLEGVERIASALP